MKRIHPKNIKIGDTVNIEAINKEVSYSDAVEIINLHPELVQALSDCIDILITYGSDRNFPDPSLTSRYSDLIQKAKKITD